MTRRTATMTRRLIAAALTLVPAAAGFGAVIPVSRVEQPTKATTHVTVERFTDSSGAAQVPAWSDALNQALTSGDVMTAAEFIGVSSQVGSIVAVCSTAAPLPGDDANPLTTPTDYSEIATLNTLTPAPQSAGVHDDLAITSGVDSPRPLVGLANALFGR